MIIHCNGQCAIQKKRKKKEAAINLIKYTLAKYEKSWVLSFFLFPSSDDTLASHICTKFSQMWFNMSFFFLPLHWGVVALLRIGEIAIYDVVLI